MRYGEIYLISTLDLAFHCIVISADSQWILFILFSKRFLSYKSLIRDCKIARFKYSFISRISYDLSGMTISFSSLSK